MPSAFGLGFGLPHLLGGGAAAPAVPDTVEFSTTSNALTRSLTLPSGATRAYGSLWVSLPAGDVDANMVVGFAVEDSSFTKNFVYFCGLDPFESPTVYRHELTVNPFTTTVPETFKFPDGDPTLERWVNILFQIDSTQAVQADRVKVWLGDAKVTAFAESDLGLNATINLGTGPHNIIVGAQSTSAFGIVDAPAKIRAAWVKFASSSLFDFEVEANRRYFIGADLSYVTHQAAMGGQTADFYGAGAVDAWTGIGWANSGGASVTVGPITSISPALPLFVPLGSDRLITFDGDIFRVQGA